MPVQFIISEGAMKTSVNGQLVDDKEYRAVYDGKDGEMLMRDNNEAIYVKMNNRDLAKLLNKSKDNKKIEDKLKSLLSKSKKSHSKKKKKSVKKSRSKKKTASKKKSVKKSRSKKKSASKRKYKSKTRTRTKRKKRPEKTTIRNLLDDDIIKTMI